MASLDTMVERHERTLVVADVRAFRPGIRIDHAELEIMSGWKEHDRRWMVWAFEDVKVEGYFHSAYGAEAEGWRRWLQRNMTADQQEAYQAGDAQGWKKS